MTLKKKSSAVGRRIIDLLTQILHQDAGMTAIVELQDALLTDLAYTLTGKAHLGTDLLKSALLTSDAEALTYDLQLTVFQDAAEHILEI